MHLRNAPSRCDSDAHRSARSLGTIVGVWAHPDDECYLSAGLMALAREAGARVVCVTATRGELGTDDPEAWPPERLAPVREQELYRSLGILGVDEHRWLDHHDGELAQVPDEVGVAQIEAIIAAVHPDTLVTFGPDGMTGHGDHVTVGRWATAAARHADRPPRVFHAATDAAVMADVDHHFDTFPVYGVEGPPVMHRDRAAVVLELPDATVEQKIAALRAQPSQTDPLVAHMGEDDYRRWVSVEVFVEASDPRD
jgi:LmbE family N-acetylglucosaminyl deacetylase